MIKKRITSQFRIVVEDDPALLELNDDALIAYVSSGYDIDQLGDLSRLVEKPTVFHVEPLRVTHEHLDEAMSTNPHTAAWEIFRTHVLKIDNIDFQPKYKTVAGRIEIDDDSRDLFPIDTVASVASIICLKARQSVEGFTPSGGFLARRSKIRARRAIAAIGLEQNVARQSSN